MRFFVAVLIFVYIYFETFFYYKMQQKKANASFILEDTYDFIYLIYFILILYLLSLLFVYKSNGFYYKYI